MRRKENLIILLIGAILKNGKIYLGHGLWKARREKEEENNEGIDKKMLEVGYES